MHSPTNTDQQQDRLSMIRFWPDWRDFNPYQKLFYQSLEGHGFAAEPGLKPTTKWLRANRGNIDFIHIHWPEQLWRRTGRNGWKQPLLILRLKRFLTRAQSCGIKVVWTIHNLAHHEGTTIIDSVGYRILRQHSDLMIVHSETAACEVRGLTSAGERIIVMEHGNYVGCYPPPSPRELVLPSLELDANIPTVACLGHIRGYKGIDLAISAVKALKGRVQLVIGGAPKNPSDIEQYVAAVADTPYVKVIARKLSPQEFSDLSAASDLILLPYRGITGSGALLSAWSFGRCAIASDLPFFREVMARYPGAINLFEAGNSQSLAAAISVSISRPAQERQVAAISARDRTAWPVVIKPVAEALSALKACPRI